MADKVTWPNQYFPAGSNTYVPSWEVSSNPPVIESELRDGYNVIDRDGHTVATFADIGAALPLMGNPGVAIRKHPAGAVNRYSRITPVPYPVE